MLTYINRPHPYEKIYFNSSVDNFFINKTKGFYTFFIRKKFYKNFSFLLKKLSFFIMFLYKSFFMETLKNKNLNSFKFLFVDFLLVLSVFLLI